jgi:hypothetical protein
MDITETVSFKDMYRGMWQDTKKHFEILFSVFQLLSYIEWETEGEDV